MFRNIRIVVLIILLCNGCASNAAKLAACGDVPETLQSDILNKDYCEVDSNSGWLSLSFWPEDNFPIQVIIDNTMPVTASVSAESAAYYWNDALGFEAFKPYVVNITTYDFPAEGYIVVSEADLSNANRDGETTLHSVTPFVTSSADVFFDYNVSFSYFWIAVHEFGHALNLGHAPFDASVMSPNAWANPCISRSDVLRLRQHYCIEQ